jgi:hypothetical protein
MNQKQLLDAILDKTSHIRGGIASQDADIVINAIDEREDLIAAYIGGNFGPLTGECLKIAGDIASMDCENTAGFKKMMDECEEKLFEARRKIKELQAGKKAANQYHGVAGANRGAVFDFKQ